eukprot:11870886-Prorocentrum_lima.AAC.1
MASVEVCPSHVDEEVDRSLDMPVELDNEHRALQQQLQKQLWMQTPRSTASRDVLGHLQLEHVCDGHCIAK